MERQYIGARYVPKFFENPNTADSAWLAGVAYEALTIVTYAGNSYTSKKPVPAGISSPNLAPEYWVNTGNFNAQVDSIRTELEETATELNSAISGVSKRTTALISGVSDRTTALETALPEKEMVFNQKKYLFVGDSYAKISGNNWVKSLVSKLGLSSANYHDMTISGTGFTSGPNGTDVNGFLTQLENAVSAGYNSEEITDIIVIGGLNDAKYETGPAASSALFPAIKAFCQYAYTHFPKAKIWIAYAGYASDTSSVLAGRTIAKRHIAQWAYSQASSDRQQAINVNIDMWKVLAQNIAFMGSDLLHPSADGGTALADQIIHWIADGVTYVHRFESITAPFNIMVDNAGIHFQTRTLNIGDEIPAMPTGYTLTSDLPFYVNKKFYAYGTIQTGAAGTYALQPIKYEVFNRTVKIYPNIITGAGWQPLPGNTAKYLLDLQFTIPWEFIG